MGVTRMNHAVLYVRDARRTADFYGRVLDFKVIIDDPHGRYAFLRAPDSANHHDLALFTIGAGARESQAGHATVGLYHIAWEVPTLAELAALKERLAAEGALVGASDHGASKSLYAKDPDGLEFEVMWLVPAEHWGAEENEAIIRPLDLAAERLRYATLPEGSGE
ncbi:VOC family protein [Spongiactinospora sp. TRM90649]|uniref:VOC family protein n=1 Tax=Spongiactinospora sp. TRM90649 TaxID=3031114 RepID=UPI0023F79EF5|nr:VOC family protein [Spongiactinospora sp. TRM90649]MDF5757552.1 VOC family protein [Spongiactinospora sp. TRM90649]